jgi:hypothetical protein
MIVMDEADLRIEQLERDLAKEQTSAAYCQLEANLVRQRLKDTLQIAMNFLDRAAEAFEQTHDDMADGINDRGQ